MTGHADIRLCKLGGDWWLVKWMYQALFFPSQAKEAKKKIIIIQKITPDLRLDFNSSSR